MKPAHLLCSSQRSRRKIFYAEGEAEKTPMDPKDDLCEVLAHHMQSYATLINPGFSSSPFRPSRELSIFPDQYDMAEAHKHLYSSPEWNNGTWQTFKSYLSKPASFQIPVAKVSQILASEQEERREDLDDDVYICVSSPEEAPSSPVCVEAEDPISDEQSLGNIETSMDIGLPSAELQIAPTPVSQSAVEDNVQSKNMTKDLKCTPTEQPNKPDDPRAEDPLTPPTSEDLPAELIVSITSAEQSVPDEVSAAKHTDFHFSGLSTMAKLPAAEVNSVIESDKAKQCLDFSVVTKHQTRTKRRRRRRRCSLVRKKISKTSVKTQSLKIAISSVEVEHLSLKTEEHNEDAILPQLRNSLKPKWKKLHRRKRRFGKLSSKKRKLRPAAVDSTKARKKKSDAVLESSKSTIFLGVEALPLRKKTERWDLKPVISECGRILFPFGSGDQVKSMPCTKMDECLERSSHEVPVTFPDPVITNKQLGTALETAIDETTATNSINGEDHQLDLGDVILTPPDGGGVPLTSNFCTAFPRNYDTNGLSKTDEAGSPVSLSAKGELLLSKLKSSDRTLCHGNGREEINTVHIEPEPDGATFGTEPVFHGCSKEISITKVGIESGTATLKILPQEDALCSPTSVVDKGVNSNIDDSNVMHTSVLDDLELKARESCKMGNSPCQDGNRDPCLDMTKTSDESVNKESDIVYNRSVVNEKLLNEKSGTSHDETDNLEGNMDCCAGLTSKGVKSVDNFSKKDDVDEKSLESTSACKEENVDKTLLEPRESPSKCEVRYVCEVDEQFTEKGDPKTDEKSSCLSRNENFVPYPCIAKEVARVNVGQQEDKVEKVVQGQEPIPFMNNVTELVAALPDKMCGPSTISTEKGELSPCKMSLIDETHTPEVLAKEFDSRSPILVIDEKPHDFSFCSSTVSSVDVLSDGEDCQKLTGESTPSTNEFPFKQKLQTSTGNTDPNHPCGLDSDVKIRTLRVLRSINEFLSATNHVDPSSQTETPDKKISVETSVFSSKKSVAPCLDSSHISGGSRNKQTNNKNMKSGSISTSQNLNRKPCDVPTSSVKIKFKDIPGVDWETTVDPDLYSYKTFVSEGLQEEQKTSQSNSSNDSRSYSQRPVMAVKPSKTEKSQTRWLSEHIDPKTTPQRKQASGHVAKHSSPTSMFLRESKQFFIEKSDALDSNHSICGPSSKTTWLANTTHSKTTKDEDKFALLNPPPQKKKRNLPTLNQIPSSRLSSVQCSKSEESCPELRDGHSNFMEYTVNGTVENITEHITERGDSDESLTCDDDDALSEDGHIADPQTSIQCTVFNTGQKRPYSFLEQFSQRCLQNDITRASMEQECLIFLEKMKNLMKKSKRDPLYQLNTYDCSMSCTSPLTVSFSSIEEEDDSVEILDTPLRHKIKVDMSNSKDQTASKEEEKVLHSVSQERNNPMEHAGISTMTAECARLYNAKMHDVCSAKKVPPRLKTKKGHQGDSRTETSNHFDFCDQMKKELDETFRSNLNAVVKKSCKTKYRFYILVTSDEVFFEETKVR
ncbi:hypothetical protein XENOCAPTIV_028701 [Xenoophorus captivus]|uniref:Uncharacterized protein n=1 Tax=Xenoophorus captivus TaxID=1517983 RepID=A0ABV0RBC1_9TELE